MRREDLLRMALTLVRAFESFTPACIISGSAGPTGTTCIEKQADEGLDHSCMNPERMCLDCQAELWARLAFVRLEDGEEDT